MADTFTTNLNLTKPEPGAAEDTWGISLNSDLDTLDAIFSSSGTQINLNPNQVNFADNKKAIFGTGSDLEIYHDGSNSYIKDAGTGSLRLRGTDLRLESSTLAHNFIVCAEGGGVTAYHNDSSKLSTTSTGINVTGVITTDGLTTSGDINFGDNDKAVFGAGSDLEIYHNANTSFITESGSSNLKIGGENLYLQNTAHNENYLAAIANGAVTLYYNNSAKLATTSTGIDVTGTTVTDALTVESTLPTITLSETDDSTYSEIAQSFGYLQISADAGNTGSGDGIVFKVDNSEAARFDSSQNFMVGGTTTPDTNGISIETSASSGGLSIISPTTGRGDIFFGDTADLNIGQIRYAHSDNSMTFRTNAADRVVIDSSGNLLVGVTSTTLTGGSLTLPNSGIVAFHDAAGNARNALQFVSGQLKHGAAGAGLTSQTFHTSNVEAMRIDSSQNVMVGGTNSRPAEFTHPKGISFRGDIGQIQASTDANTALLLNRDTSDGTIIEFRKDGTTVGSIGAESSKLNIGNGDTGIEFNAVQNAIIPHNQTSNANVDNSIDLGFSSLRFKDLHLSGNVISDGYFKSGSNVYIGKGSSISGSYGANDIVLDSEAANSKIIFRNLGGNESARIDGSGNFLIGKTSSDFGATAGIELNGQYDVGYFTRSAEKALVVNRLSTDGTIVDFRKDGTSVGSVSVTSSATTYNTSSDARLKDVTGQARGLDVINALNPVSYNWKADGKADEGLIAQEVQEIVPNAVSQNEDQYYQMDYSKLVVHLVKGMKEQQEQIESLKSEIANLKGE